MQEVARDIEGIEALVAQANSLQHKLCGNDDCKEFASFIVQLMRSKEVSVPGGARGNIGSRITTMFRDAQKVSVTIADELLPISKTDVRLSKFDFFFHLFVFRVIQATQMMGSGHVNNDVETSSDGKLKTFPEPSCKEFILRAITPRPSPTSTPQPQRMYACLKRDYIRIAGFFSEDTTFF